MPSNAELLDRRARAIPRGIGSACPVVAARAENAEVWDVEGRRYIDFAAGIAVLNVGHGHPRVVAAAREQLDRIAHPCFQVTPYEPYIELAERLNRLAPGPSPKKSIFLTTGAEAVENAVKIARRATGRSAVIAFAGGFHGRTMLAMALTGKVAPYKAGFGPMPGEVYHVPFPTALHGVSVDDSIHAIEAIFKSEVEPGRVAAILLEPVQGEGGFYVAPPELMRRLRELCDEHGIILIADEIQTGFARTGELFAMHHHDGVEADLMTVAKSLAGGLPLSGVIGRADVMDAPETGGLGGTYGGNAVACAAAHAVLDVIEEEDLCARARAQGERIDARMRAAAERHAIIAEVRGIGAMRAIEIFETGAACGPSPALAKAIQTRAVAHGLLVLPCGLYGNVLRLLAPLTIPEALLEEGLDILERAIDETTEGR